MSAFADLMTFQRETEALGQVMGRLGWDQETMMPSGAAEQRAEEMAALAGVLHRRRTDPRIGDWLEAAAPESETDSRQLAEVRREFNRTQKVPEALAAELARTTSLAHRVWAEARASEDIRRKGVASGAKYWRGCGSKVRMPSGASWARAMSITAQWPR